MGQPNQIELETKIAMLERTLDALNDVILEQGHSIEALQRKIERLEGRLTNVADSSEEARDLESERPPHY